MLPRAALGAIKASSQLRNATSTASASPWRIARYASSSSKPRRPPPPPAGSRPPAKTAKPPRNPFPGATEAARQTSPGTALPKLKEQGKDQTWKAQDAIKFGGPAAAGGVASSPVGGARPAAGTRSPLEGDAGGARGREPAAQHQGGSDAPVAGGVREAAQAKMAESEQQPPPEQTGPLPDLRQGIPSTFDFEFGASKQQAQQKAAGEEKSAEDMLDLTSSPDDAHQRKERGEREYARSDYETSLDRRRAQMANYLYLSILFTAVSGVFYFARPFSAVDDVPAGLNPEDASGWAPGKLYARVRARLGNQMGYYTEPSFPQLLPDVPESQRPPFTLVLSLEDLMIHTTWDTRNGYRTAKRPGIDYFVRYLSQYFELVLFTSVPRAMADPVVAKLDPYHFIMWPLGREATKYENGEYVKDLSYLNRDLKKTIIVDTHAPHVKNQPENAIILPKWTGDPKDPHTKDLVALIPFLEYVATMGTDDVRTVLKSFQGKSIPEEFARREALAREKFQAQLAEEKSRKPRFSLGSIASGLGVKGGGSMGGGMVLADGQSVAEGLAQGKMLSDQIREQGQRQYEHLETQIREHGEQWLREEAEEQKKMVDAQMKDMKQGAMSWFVGGGEAKKE